MIKTLANTNTYIACFEQIERELDNESPSWLRPIRRAAIARFDALGFPSHRHEAWRFTDLTPITRQPFFTAPAFNWDQWVAQRIFEPGLLQNPSNRLVFVNGIYSPGISITERLPRAATVSSLAEVLQTRPRFVEPHLARYASFLAHPFVALNTAFLRDGAFIQLPKGTVIKEPIHLIHVSKSAGTPSVSYPRNLIVVGTDCQATIVETYLGFPDDVYLTNSVTEIVVGERSIVDHYKVQREGTQAFHVGTVDALQNRSSRLMSNWISLGGRLVRNETHVRLGQQDCTCTLHGLFLAAGKQHVDSRTCIDHTVPRGQSRQVYKGVLKDHSSAVFTGKIHVHQDAQKTDARQSSQALLLSENAQIHAKPELEIFADDVKCTHGSTVGREDADALFYLRSRGIDRQKAHDLLVYAFANSVVNQIHVPSIRAHIEEKLLGANGRPQNSSVGDA